MKEFRIEKWKAALSIGDKVWFVKPVFDRRVREYRSKVFRGTLLDPEKEQVRGIVLKKVLGAREDIPWFMVGSLVSACVEAPGGEKYRISIEGLRRTEENAIKWAIAEEKANVSTYESRMVGIKRSLRLCEIRKSESLESISHLRKKLQKLKDREKK